MFRSALIFLALTLSLSAVEVAALTPMTLSVAENVMVADKTLKSFDANGDLISGVIYTMTANGHWVLVSASGPLRQTANYDFESSAETADKNITIFATGPGGSANPLTIAVTVTDVNEAPGGITFSGAQAINENAAGVVAAGASFGDVDAPATNDYRWSLISPPSGLNDNSHFRIDNSTGILSLDSAFDYETLDPAGRRNGTGDKIFSRAFVELKDGNLTARTKEIWIEIRDVNEAPSDMILGGTQVIDENATGSVATSASSGDVDAPATNSYVWSLVVPPGGVNDNGKFAINASTGALSVSSAFDYETLVATANDRRNGTSNKIFARAFVSLKDGTFSAITQEVWIEIRDVNEAPTRVTFGGGQAIDENVTGSVATSASSGDVDAPATNSYVWSLVDPQSGVNDNGNFTISASTGALSVSGAFNYEFLIATANDRRNGTSNKIFARAFVSLKDGTFSAITKEVWIEIRDVNEAPTRVTFGGGQAIDENVTGSVATSASSGDVDAPATNSYVWSLVDPQSGVNDNGNFTINTSTGALSVSSDFDYETLVLTATNRHNGDNSKIFARAFVSLKDGAFPQIMKEVWIEVHDLNEAPTGIALVGAGVINENTTGEVVTCTSTGDFDTPSTNRYVWSKFAPTSGMNDNAFFEVNPTDGRLSLITGCNYEELHDSHLSNGAVVLHAWVKLTDGAFAPIVKEALFTLTDVDEPPVIVGWDVGTSLTDPTVNLRVGNDPSFSLADPDLFNPSFNQYDDLQVRIDLTRTNDQDELSLSADLLSQLTLTPSNGVVRANWPFSVGTPGIATPIGIATMSLQDNKSRVDIQFNLPTDSLSAPVGHVTAAMVKEVLRTIMFGNTNQNYVGRQTNPSVKISYPGKSVLPTVRFVDVTNINAPPIVSQASSTINIQRGSSGILDQSAVLVLDDHPDTSAILVIDALPTAGALQRVTGGVASVLRVGDSIPLVRVGNLNQLECQELSYVPSPSSSATADSFICHAVDGGVLVSGKSKFPRSSPLTRISLTIKEAATPRFSVPDGLTFTYTEQAPVPLLIGKSLTFSVPATSFGNWRLVINGVVGTNLTSNGLDPHDVLSLAPGLVIRSGNTLTVDTV